MSNIQEVTSAGQTIAKDGGPLRLKIAGAFGDGGDRSVNAYLEFAFEGDQGQTLQTWRGEVKFSGQNQAGSAMPTVGHVLIDVSELPAGNYQLVNATVSAVSSKRRIYGTLQHKDVEPLVFTIGDTASPGPVDAEQYLYKPPFDVTIG